MHYGRWRTEGDPGEAAPRYVSTSATIPERLRHTGWAVTDAGCWEWNGTRALNGYGIIAIGGHVQKYAHRVSYQTHRGTIPDGYFVCHRCDNRICINPDHLFLGTIQDNNADMVGKGRVARGERAYHARLTADDVLTIRAERAKGVPGAELAARFGITRGYVYSLAARRGWKHLLDDGSTVPAVSIENGRAA